MRTTRIPRLAVLAVAATALIGLVAGCSDSPPPAVDYVVDATVDTYNANTVDGNAHGVLMATTRMLPGFSYLGAAGQVTPDRDVGTVTRQPGSRLTLRYEFNPKAVFSDGQPLDCDDLVLAWAAMSGRFEGFRPATTEGYRDIETVDCRPGDKAATVTFAPGRDDRNWAALFGAGTMLPAHVVARAAGVADVVAPIRAMNRGVIDKIANYWNTGFAVRPGGLDATVLPSSGPFRIDGHTGDGGLVLVRNDKWWGAAPATDRIVIWGRGTDVPQRLSEGRFDVTDVTAGLTGSPIGGSDSDSPQPEQAPGRALGVEGLVLAERGVFGDPAARRAFASCVPRNELARRFGSGAQMWNLRTVAPADNLAGQINGEFGREYNRVDTNRARRLLAGDGGTPRPIRVRIGYQAPAERWRQMVAAIADSCRPAGITVDDASAPDLDPGALGRQADALLVTNGASFSAAGAADPIRAAYQLRAGDPLNLGGYRDPQVSKAIDDLGVASLGTERLGLIRTIENGAWRDVPSIPLFAAPRERRSSSAVGNVVPGLARNGTGWNMDRWTSNE
ncbi:ABC transporter substrate-binding protein [Gordonia sinesedis]